MKKLILSLVIITALLIPQICFAIKENSYNDFYNYVSDSRSFTFNKDYENKKEQNYKIAKKLNRLYKKNKHEKILKKYPDFVPSIFYSFESNFKNNKYNDALKQLDEIAKLDHNFSQEQMNIFYFATYYGMKDYNKALNISLKIKDKEKIQYYLANCYLNLKKYNTAIEIAKKIKKEDKKYYLAQEILFKAYYRQKNFEKAKIVANKLLRLNSKTHDNYIRLALLEKDPKKQLEYYYQGRNKANDDEIFLHLNAIIVKKEQEKINAAFKKLKVYSEKPEWTKVIEDSEYGTEDYWIERQDEFFENTNKCVYNYSDNQLAKCFEAVNNKQIRLNNELEDDIKDQMLFDYQEKIISQNNKIIRQQRYNNYIQSLQYHELLQINNNINKDIEINFW